MHCSAAMSLRKMSPFVLVMVIAALLDTVTSQSSTPASTKLLDSKMVTFEPGGVSRTTSSPKGTDQTVGQTTGQSPKSVRLSTSGSIKTRGTKPPTEIIHTSSQRTTVGSDVFLAGTIPDKSILSATSASETSHPYAGESNHQSLAVTALEKETHFQFTPTPLPPQQTTVRASDQGSITNPMEKLESSEPPSSATPAPSYSMITTGVISEDTLGPSFTPQAEVTSALQRADQTKSFPSVLNGGDDHTESQGITLPNAGLSTQSPVQSSLVPVARDKIGTGHTKKPTLSSDTFPPEGTVRAEPGTNVTFSEASSALSPTSSLPHVDLTIKPTRDSDFLQVTQSTATLNPQIYEVTTVPGLQSMVEETSSGNLTSSSSVQPEVTDRVPWVFIPGTVQPTVGRTSEATTFTKLDPLLESSTTTQPTSGEPEVTGDVRFAEAHTATYSVRLATTQTQNMTTLTTQAEACSDGKLCTTVPPAVRKKLTTEKLDTTMEGSTPQTVRKGLQKTLGTTGKTTGHPFTGMSQTPRSSTVSVGGPVLTTTAPRSWTVSTTTQEPTHSLDAKMIPPLDRLVPGTPASTPHGRGHPSAWDPCSGVCSPLPSFNRTSLSWDDLRRTLAFAWEMHVYGTASLFLLLSLWSLINLIGMPIVGYPRCTCLCLTSALLLITGGCRAGYFLTDPYGSKEVLRRPAQVGLYNLAFPLLLSAFGTLCLLAFRMARLHVLPASLQRLPVVAAVAVLHTTLLLAADLLFLAFNPSVQVVLQVLSVSWGTFLNAGYLYSYPRLKRQTSPSLEDGLREGGSADALGYILESSQRRQLLVLSRVLTICAILGLLCCGLQVYAILWLYDILGDWRLFTWSWWLVQFWYRLLELAWGFSMLVVATWVYWRQGDNRGTSGSHTCWVKIVQSLCSRKQQGRKYESSNQSNGAGNGTLDLPNNRTNQDRTGVDISKNLIRNHPENVPLRTLKENNESKARLALYAPQGGGSTNSLLLLKQSGIIAGKSHNLAMLRRSHSTVCFEKESVLSLTDFDLRPPSPIDLSRSIDEALYKEHLVKDSIFSQSGFLTHHLDADNSESSFQEVCPNQNDGISQSVYRRRSSDPNYLYSLTKCSSLAELNTACGQEEKTNGGVGGNAVEDRNKSLSYKTSPPVIIGNSPASPNKMSPVAKGKSPTSGRDVSVQSSSRLGTEPSEYSLNSSFSGLSVPISFPLLRGQGLSPTETEADLSEPFLREDCLQDREELCDPDSEARQTFLEISRQIDSVSIISDTIDL
ncbi:uncharacterized protein LOC120540425 [Polypterus senegalus]|uniref:uncharacterized protein LOC120540425 n=1 Tax=Polypterus senegalus TaxID=55291 RepID=UPI001965298C|nr:uncharacterized protein LOC120540425 [Polypterus senegalus]XP_039627151.1 uncharacterized protein LOC120540425 [Polypterus senegalus]XP_039627152.1 uncharacterized protein LOC120540425 [Polypterus senegalus]